MKSSQIQILGILVVGGLLGNIAGCNNGKPAADVSAVPADKSEKGDDTSAASSAAVSSAAHAMLPTPTLLWEGDGVTGKADGASLTGYTWLDSQASTQATSLGIEMSYHANVLGGHAVVRDFSASGNNQWWVSDAQMPNTLLTGTSDYTIVVLAKPAVVTGNTGFVATWGTQNSQWYIDPTYMRIVDTVGAWAAQGDVDLTDTFSIYVYSRNGAAIEMSYGELAPGANLSSLVVGNRPGDLGVENGQPRRMNFMHSGGGFRGDLAEIIFYDSHLSSSQLADVEAYLDAKYSGEGPPGKATNPSPQKEFFVAPDGSDANLGTKSRPFQTIRRAANMMQPGDTCTVRAGVYRETVRPARSGTRGKPIRFRNYPGEKVAVHGTDAVRGWRHHEGAIYKVELGWETEQVFVDGQMMIEARWPNTGPDLMHPALARTDTSTTATKLIDAALTQPDGYWDGAKLWIRPGGGWRGDNSTVTRYVKGELDILPNSMAATFGHVELFKKYVFPSPGNSYYLTRGPLSSLDSPGEWWLDRETFTLYIWLPGDEDPSDHRVEAKRRTNAFDLTGLSHIQVSGFWIFGATITMADATRCQIDDCHLRYLSHVVDIVHKVGYEAHGHDTGLIVGGSENEVHSCSIVYSAGNGVVLLPKSSSCKIINCLIHEINYAYVDCAAIHAIGTGHLISHNSLYNTGDAVIYARGNLKSSRIEYNDMHHGGMFSSDVGIIYVLGEGEGTVIAHNWVHDNLSSLHGPGIYLDSGANNYRVHHNVVWNMNPSSSAIVLSAPNSNNLIANNTTHLYRKP